MKYGLFYMPGLDTIDACTINGDYNLGDVIRDDVVYHLYKRMGILDQDIVRIYPDELYRYDGEAIVLPFNTYLYYNYGNVGSASPMSSKIIPVFLSTATIFPEIASLKNLHYYEPIGCRDEYTYTLLKQEGIKCYINGCLTLLYQKRERHPIDGKIFFVDVPKEVKQYIPSEIQERAVFLTHDFPFPKNLGSNEQLIETLVKTARNRLALYRDEAVMVVSSRVHCLSPCIAMGIPVIWCRSVLDVNGTFLESLTHCYTQKEYDKIEWTPKVTNIKDIQDLMFRNFEKQVRDAYDKHKDIETLTETFRLKKPYHFQYYKEAPYIPMVRSTVDDTGKPINESPTVNYYLYRTIQELLDKTLRQIDLVIFGAGSAGKSFLEETYKLPDKFKSICFIDNDCNKHNSMINGIPVYPVKRLRDVDLGDAFIILCGLYQDEFAKQLTEDYGLTEQKHYFKSHRIYAEVEWYKNKDLSAYVEITD